MTDRLEPLPEPEIIVIPPVGEDDFLPPDIGEHDSDDPLCNECGLPLGFAYPGMGMCGGCGRHQPLMGD